MSGRDKRNCLRDIGWVRNSAWKSKYMWLQEVYPFMLLQQICRYKNSFTDTTLADKQATECGALQRQQHEQARQCIYNPWRAASEIQRWWVALQIQPLTMSKREHVQRCSAKNITIQATVYDSWTLQRQWCGHHLEFQAPKPKCDDCAAATRILPQQLPNALL